MENSSSEKSSDNSVAEVVPEKDAETPAAQDTTSVVEDKSETPEMTASSEKPEEEGSNAATEESNEAEEETIDEKPEIKVQYNTTYHWKSNHICCSVLSTDHM